MLFSSLKNIYKNINKPLCCLFILLGCGYLSCWKKKDTEECCSEPKTPIHISASVEQYLEDLENYNKEKGNSTEETSDDDSWSDLYHDIKDNKKILII